MLGAVEGLLWATDLTKMPHHSHTDQVYGLGNNRHEIDGNQFLIQVHRRGATGLEENVHKGMGNGQTGR